MAKRQVVTYSYTCDVCGVSVDEDAGRKLGWDGHDVVVDLCGDHDKQLAAILTQLKVFVDAGAVDTRGRGRHRRPSTVANQPAKKGSPAVPPRRDVAAIRRWARETGRAVNERGRLPEDLLAEYDAASSSPPPPPVASPNIEAAAAPVVDAAVTPRPPRQGSRSRRPAAATSPSSAKRSDLGAVRVWARENGHKVSERGRISAELLAAYDAANRTAGPSASAATRRRVRKAAK